MDVIAVISGPDRLWFVAGPCSSWPPPEDEYEMSQIFDSRDDAMASALERAGGLPVKLLVTEDGETKTKYLNIPPP